MRHLVCVLVILEICYSHPQFVCKSCVDQAIKEKKCTIDYCNCVEDKTNFNIGKIGRSQKIAPPKLICREDRIMIFNPQKYMENSVHYLEYKPRGQNNSVKFSNISLCENLELTNLEPNTPYKVRIHVRNFEKNITMRSPFEIAKTHPSNYTLLPVENLTQILKVQDNNYNSTLEWSYRNETDRSCAYDIVWFDEKTGHHYLEEIIQPVNNYTISKLDFEKEFFVVVRGTTKNRIKESIGTNITIVVPSCIETFKNLEKCVPAMPAGVEVQENLMDHGLKPTYDIVINWLPPVFTPDYYTITLTTEDQEFTSGNISRNATTETLHNIELGLEYDIWLVAWSLKGASRPAGVHRKINTKGVALVPHNQVLTYKHVTAAAGGTLGAAIAIAIAILLWQKRCWLKQRSSENSRKFAKEVNLPSSKDKFVGVKHFKNNEWMINEDDLTISCNLGKGAFGVVRKGTYTKNGTNMSVAIKMLKDAATQEQIVQFYDEIEIMKSVPKHPHLVSLIGIVTNGREDNPLMVVEYCAKGDLQSFLKNAWEILTTTTQNIDYVNNINLYKTYVGADVFSNKLYEVNMTQDDLLIHPKELISMARQIALGMEFLSSIKVLHRDLATRNVLVCEDNTIKISDFGLSRDVYRDNVYLKTGGGKLPFRWMALESMTHQRYTTQSDVWSFGILLWEIVTLGSTPYPGVNTQDLLYLLKSGYRMEKPHNCSDELYSVMTSCWQPIPQDRPTFSELVAIFEKFLENESLYLSLNIGPQFDKLADSRYATGNGIISPTQSDRYQIPLASGNKKCEKT